MEETSNQEQEKTLEAKIQNQFNEEKWSRISAKDVSISRFKILENLFLESQEQNYLDELLSLSKAHLLEYKLSVAARFFIGMIALKENNPEDIIYLKQILEQFQEISKWAVVEYLSEKMLSVSENRTILRAQALALEKLGKNKEMIPVLEKLAKIDRKNPDIAMKYADAIIDDDLEKGIQFYKQAAESFAKNLQFENLKIVWNKLVELIPEDFVFFKKIERILSGHRRKEIIADLFVELIYYYINKEDLDNIIILSKKILEYNPNYTRFKNELIKSYKEKYKEHSLLEEFIKFSGLTNSKKNIANSITNFETNIVFDKDNYVNHRQWGVGKIKDLTTKEMIIDFKEKENHKMDIQMALRSLKPLSPDHFLVQNYEQPEKVKDLFENDKIEFFKLLLKSFGNQLSLADIKGELSGVFVPEKEWSKWWPKTRTAILKDPMISVSPKRKDVLELQEVARSFSEVIIEKFQAAVGSFDDRISVVFQAFKNSSESISAVEYMLPFFKETLNSLELEVRIQSLWILDFFQEILEEDEKLYDEAVKVAIIQEFKNIQTNDLLDFAAGLKETEMKKQLAIWIQEYSENWEDIFVQLLFQTPIKIHKYIMNTLIETESWVTIQSFFTKIRKDAKNNIEVFLWTMKNMINDNWVIPDFQFEEHLLSFFRILKVIPKVELKGTKLKNSAKDMLNGKTSDLLFAKIQMEAISSVRKFVSLFKDIPFFSEVEKDLVIKNLMDLNKQLFEDEVEDESEANLLINELKENGSTIATADAIKKMKEKLDYLIQVEIPKNSNDIGVAQEKGDLRENAEYKAAMEKQTQLQAEMKALEKNIKETKKITSSQIVVDKVSLGSKVRLYDEKNDDVFVYYILDKWDADVDKGIISYKSPLGKALLDSKKGSIVEFGTEPNKHIFKVEAISKAVDEKGNLI